MVYRARPTTMVTNQCLRCLKQEKVYVTRYARTQIPSTLVESGMQMLVVAKELVVAENAPCEEGFFFFLWKRQTLTSKGLTSLIDVVQATLTEYQWLQGRDPDVHSL